MWQDILKGAVANILIDWTELKYYDNILIYEGESAMPLTHTRISKLIDKLEVKYSVGISKELTTTGNSEEVEGIVVSLDNAKTRITIEGQTLETDATLFDISAIGTHGSNLSIRPKFVSMIINKNNGKYEFKVNPRMRFESYD